MGTASAPSPEPIRTRADAEAWLDHLTWHGIKLGLETPRRLLEGLGDPHRAYPVIHIAGTNGKGSTALLADTLLSATGMRVGRYTSPHLSDLSERMTVGGVPITDEALTRHIARIAGISRSLPLPPTFFEVVTAAALAHFAMPGAANPSVDAAVVEVGMGGRLDATNVVTPRVCVITNVSLEHTEHLGATIAEVAAEKAGIIKPGVPVVTGAGGEALEVIARVAAERGAPCHVLGRDFGLIGGERFAYQGMRTNYHGLTLGLSGVHQRDNAALALAAVELFLPPGVAAAESRVTRALAAARVPGRLERVDTDPEILLDTAHNGAAAAVLARHLAAHPMPTVLVLGVLRDKDFFEIAHALAPVADRVVITAPDTPRAGDPGAQAGILRGMGARVSVAVPVAEAVEKAVREARGLGGRAVVAGSVYTVGEARNHLTGTVA